MRFQKNNQLGFTSDRTRKLAKQPISFKGFEGQLEELKKIPGWQDSLRGFVDKLIDASNIDGGFNHRWRFLHGLKPRGFHAVRRTFYD